MSKLKTKTTFLGVVISLFMIILTSCVGDSESRTTTDTENDAKTNDEVTLSLLICDTADNAGLRAVVDAIEEELHIKTDIEIRPSGPEGVNVVKTRLATGEI